jgi:hypothetical protein
MQMAGSLTDDIVAAAKATAEVYTRTAALHGAKGRTDYMMVEAKRAALMEALAADDNLCEMFAGRLHKLRNMA